MKNPKTANETQHKHAIQNQIMYAQCSASSAPGPMRAMKYALSEKLFKNEAHKLAPVFVKKKNRVRAQFQWS